MKTGFSIRPLTPEDETFLLEMVYQAIYVPEGQPPLPRSIVEAPKLAHYARQWGQLPGDLGFAVVDEASGQPVGAAWLRLFHHLDPGYGYVDDVTPELSIALLPGYRGLGLGSRLMHTLMDAAGQTFEAVSLSVAPENAAYRLYQRLGFSYVGTDGSSITMVKRFI